MFDNLINVLLSTAGVITAVVIIVKFIVPTVRAIRSLFHTVNNFFADWYGEEARPGRGAVPGVMERLNDIDGALKNNGGGSLKDAIDRIEVHVSNIDERLNAGDALFQEIQEELEQVKDIVHQCTDATCDNHSKHE